MTPAPFGETVTSLFAGEGSDTVTVSVAAGPAQALMVAGQGGDDTIDGSASTLPLVVFGGDGNDTIAGGSAGDTLFGDTGRVEYLRPAGAGGYDVVLGGPAIASYHSAPAAPDGDFLTADIVYTDGFAGANTADTISGNDGNDLILGGPSGDSIDAGAGNDIVFGDNGRIVFDPALPILAQTEQPGSGGDDVIAGGLGSDILFGGAGNDTITTGGGTDVVIGDNGQVDWGLDGNTADIDRIMSTDPTEGGIDRITVDAGNAIVIGGAGGDIITAAGGDNIVLGDGGEIDAALSDATSFGSLPLTVGTVFSTDPTLGGDDMITTGAGNDFVIGGYGGDTIDAGDGNNVVVGDNGLLVFNGADGNGATFDLVQTIAPSAGGGVDGITTGSGDDVVLGGDAGDTIHAGDGNNVVLGDNGAVSFFGGKLDLIQSTETGDDAPAQGGSDSIFTGAGNDVIVGGFAGDTINAGDGNNVVFGDSAVLDYGLGTGVLLTAASIAPTFGGDDGITTGFGQ